MPYVIGRISRCCSASWRQRKKTNRRFLAGGYTWCLADNGNEVKIRTVASDAGGTYTNVWDLIFLDANSFTRADRQDQALRRRYSHGIASLTRSTPPTPSRPIKPAAGPTAA